VEREGVVAVLPRRTEQASNNQHQTQAAPQAAPQAPPAPPVTPPRDRAFIGVLTALTHLLAARFLLLLAVVGAFILAVMAMPNGGYPGLAILIAYCSLTVLPLVYLDIETHRRGAR